MNADMMRAGRENALEILDSISGDVPSGKWFHMRDWVLYTSGPYECLCCGGAKTIKIVSGGIITECPPCTLMEREHAFANGFITCSACGRSLTPADVCCSDGSETMPPDETYCARCCHHFGR